MNIFVENGYRKILDKIVRERKNFHPNINFQALAEVTRIPKSYISKVINEKAHFSPDQLFAFCRALELKDEQTDYLMLCLEHERSVIQQRKRILAERIKGIQAKHLDSTKYMKLPSQVVEEKRLQEYYLDPLNQLVHILLSIPKYQTNLKKIAEDLSWPLAEIMRIIKQLEALELIVLSHGRYQPAVKKIHLPRESPVYKFWRNQTKLLSMERLNRFSNTEDYSFSVTFSATQKTKIKIQVAFLDFLKSVETLVDESDKEDAFQLNFDLFRWT